jgi:glyoxylase-like metal-dependent hydrolase (beta-lactamase superfamily II)
MTDPASCPICDHALDQSGLVVAAALDHISARPKVRAFFDEPTFTASYVVHDPATRRAAIIDPVLDYDAASGRTSHAPAEAIVSFVESERLSVDWLLET